jgi:hypothetical protein
MDPPLSYLLHHPLTRMLMSRDGVELYALERLLAAKRARGLRPCGKMPPHPLYELVEITGIDAVARHQKLRDRLLYDFAERRLRRATAHGGLSVAAPMIAEQARRR